VGQFANDFNRAFADTNTKEVANAKAAKLQMLEMQADNIDTGTSTFDPAVPWMVQPLVQPPYTIKLG
jgi:hypothetical protein